MAWPARLETDRLLLRPLVDTDLGALLRGLGDWEVARWLIRVPFPYTVEAGRAWVADCAAKAESRQRLHFSLEPRGGSGIVGAVGLELHAHGIGHGELGYWLARPVWGQGLGTEAAQAMLRAGFRDLRLDSIRAGADPANHGSNRVLEKAGFRFVGVDPLHERALRGPPAPANLWRIDRTEWEAAHGAA